MFFIGFGAVDPYMGKWAADEVHRIAELGLRGLKFQRISQGFLSRTIPKGLSDLRGGTRNWASFSCVTWGPPESAPARREAWD